jgi:hypothetical protein
MLDSLEHPLLVVCVLNLLCFMHLDFVEHLDRVEAQVVFTPDYTRVSTSGEPLFGKRTHRDELGRTIPCPVYDG